MSASKGQLIVLHDRRDRADANRIVRKLETEGFRVARTDNAAALRGRAVDTPTLLLWSRNAPKLNVNSALSSDTAVIVKLDSRPAPLVDAMVTDLRGWMGRDQHRGWKSLLSALSPAQTSNAATSIAPIQGLPSLESRASAPAYAPTQPAGADQPEAKKSSGLGWIIGGVVLALGAAAGAAAYFLM